MADSYKRQRTGVLSSGYFNSIGLPGVQALDVDGNSIEDPANRNQIHFDGNAAALYFPQGMLFTEGGELKVNQIDSSTGEGYVTTIGPLNTSVPDPLTVNELMVDGPSQFTDRMYFGFIDNANTVVLQGGRGGSGGMTFSYYDVGGTNDELIPLFFNKTSVQARVFMDMFADANVQGTLSKSSGSFKISHPLHSKKDTHHLVHSFTESPQADLVYSGMVDLGTDGKVTVDIDAEVGMTPGTFEALCKNVRYVTSNEGGFTAIKSTFTGCCLDIEAADSACRDKVYWQVIGQRKDPAIVASSMTDADGNVVLEPLKPIPEDEEDTTMT